MRVAAVVLAAGGSTRFGKPKQLARFRGETFVSRIVKAAIEAGCDPVVVVTGEDSAQIESGLKGLAVRIAVNPDWPTGLASSIRGGLENAMEGATDLGAALLVTCDQPFVDGAVIDTAHPIAFNQWQTDRCVRLRRNSRHSRPIRSILLSRSVATQRRQWSQKDHCRSPKRCCFPGFSCRQDRHRHCGGLRKARSDVSL